MANFRFCNFSLFVTLSSFLFQAFLEEHAEHQEALLHAELRMWAFLFERIIQQVAEDVRCLHGTLSLRGA